jgi:integration host factor subunit alpha
MAMTKIEVIDLIYSELGYQKRDATRVVGSFFEIIKDELVKGNDVLISGFGKWSVREKNERRGRNPQSGEDIVIEARKVVCFKCSPRLKKALEEERP